MQLLCNNVLLDLKQGTKLQFKKSNILFAFDDIECERTMSFDIPDTPNNEVVLGFAKDPAFAGTGMRQRLTATLMDGIVVKQGHLHVDSYAKGSYKAVFVTGELVGLQAIRDAGSIAEQYKNSTDYVEYNTTVLPPSSVNSEILWANIRQLSEDGAVKPSLYMGKAIKDTLDALGASYILPSDLTRIVVAKPQGFQERACKFRRFPGQNHVEGAEWADVEVGNTGESALCARLFTHEQVAIEWNEYDSGGAIISTIHGTVECLKARQNVKIAFDNVPADIFLSYDTATPNPVPLANTEITVDKGRSFFFYRNSEFILDPNYGYSFTQTFDVDARVRSANSDPEDGDIIMLADNVPDVTAVALLKTMAAMHGQVLIYEAGVVKFDNVQYTTFPLADMTDSLLTIKTLTRTFGSYARTNILKFKDAEWVLPSERITVAYTVPNDNIEEHSVLLDAPFSEGGADIANNAYLYLRNDANDFVFGDADPLQSGYSLVRVRFRKNIHIQQLCTTSTTIDVQVAMTLFEWEALAPRIVIHLSGKRYMWTAGTWQQGVATLKLSQI